MADDDLTHPAFPCPPGFPREPYEKLLRHLRAGAGGWAEPTLLAAWDAVAYHYRACAEHGARFGRLAGRAAGVGAESAYQLHAALFGFFSYGVAAVESFCYAVHAVGSHTVAPGFSLTSPSARRAVTPDATLARLTALGRDLRITRELGGVLGSAGYRVWVRNRNELARRAAPPRTHGAVVRWPKFDSGDIIRLELEATRSRLNWLSASLRVLLEAAEELTRERLAAP
jgi:hypothetical protein